MSLTYGFYNSISGDRLYSAEQMSSIFEGMIHDGIFEDIDDKLEVVATTGMNVKVGKGRAWFNKTWTKNDSDIILTVDNSEVILKRIDVVVLEVDASVEVRANTIKIVKGTPGSSPVAPTLVNTENVHQYPLAHIFVEVGVTSILTADITSKVGTVDCPYVKGVLRNIDTIAVDTIMDGFDDLSEEVALQRTFFDDNIGQTANKTTLISTDGSANAYTVTYTENIPTTYAGLFAQVRASFSNTGAATINFNSLGVKSIKKLDGNGKSALVQGDMIIGNSYTLIFDGTDVVLMNPTCINSSIITAAGDLLVGSGANLLSRLALGSSDYALVSKNGILTYGAPINGRYNAGGSLILNRASENQQFYDGSGSYFRVFGTFAIKFAGRVQLTCEAWCTGGSVMKVIASITGDVTSGQSGNPGGTSGNWQTVTLSFYKDALAGETLQLALQCTAGWSGAVRNINVYATESAPSNYIY